MALPTLPKVYNVYYVAIIATLGGMLYGFPPPPPHPLLTNTHTQASKAKKN